MRVEVPARRRLTRPGHSMIGLMGGSLPSFVGLYGSASLISYWKLDEASGSRADSYGTNTLTDNNTVTQNPGKLGKAAQITLANTEWLSVASNSSLQSGNIDFTITAWVYLDSKATSEEIVTKLTGALALGEYQLQYSATSDRFQFQTWDTAVVKGTVDANNLGSPSTATWYYVIAWRDKTAATVNIQVNNGTVNSAAETGPPATSAEGFSIGALSTLGQNGWDGRIDSVGFWKRTLNATERAALYNSGNGMPIVGSE